MKPDICIHHMPCADGFTAAWAVWKRWPDIECVPGVYGTPPPNVKGKHVLIVDFSYKAPVLMEMADTAASITVIDHHKTAEADLKDFAGPALVPLETIERGRIQALFDMSKSGAMLAWEHAHPGIPAPWIVRYVEDRDLWRFNYAETRQVNAVLFSYAYDFEQWEELARELEGPEGRAAICREGEAIERKHFKDVDELLGITTRDMTIGGHQVRVANVPYTLSSDAAGKLAEGAPFGACYYDNSEGKRVFSLRSRDGGIDVSTIASSYGGGGHAKASGFTAPKGWEGDQA